MRVLVKSSKQQLNVFAISWPKSSVKHPVISPQTMFSAGDKHGVSEFYFEEITMLNSNLSNFEFTSKFDENYFMLIWKPLYEAQLWDSLRNYEPSAIEIFSTLLEKEGLA